MTHFQLVQAAWHCYETGPAFGAMVHPKWCEFLVHGHGMHQQAFDKLVHCEVQLPQVSHPGHAGATGSRPLQAARLGCGRGPSPPTSRRVHLPPGLRQLGALSSRHRSNPEKQAQLGHFHSHTQKVAHPVEPENRSFTKQFCHFECVEHQGSVPVASEGGVKANVRMLRREQGVR